MNDSLNSVLRRGVAASELELWGHEWTMSSGRRILRVFVDSQDGVSLDECAKASRQISAILDVDADIEGAYTLEVSSPGVNRQLFDVSQFHRYVGAQIQCRLRDKVLEKRHLQGVLQSVGESSIQMVVADASVSVAFSNIDRANIVEV